jgi:hypothetical protein
MTTPSLANRLRALAESLEPGLSLKPDDPDLLKIKRILLEEVAALEAEASSNASTNGPE